MTNEQLWQAVLGELELSLSKANFTTWFKSTSISQKEAGKIIIAVPNAFTRTWLEKKYNDSILKALKSLTDNEIKEVFYKVETLPQKQPAYSPSPKINGQGSESIDNLVDVFGLNKKYVFEN
ncbi:MAG TPA: DnaA N-terminal domain-containing protein, partial [Patescibacteria group bacterium]